MVNSMKNETKRKNAINFGLREKLIVIMIIVGVAPILALSMVSSVSYSVDTRETWLNNLDAIGGGKRIMIEDWFTARREEMLSLTLNDKFQFRTSVLDANPNNTGVRETVHTNIFAVIDAFHSYNEIYLLDSEAVIIAQQNATGWEDGHDLGHDQTGKAFFTACQDNHDVERYTHVSDMR